MDGMTTAEGGPQMTEQERDDLALNTTTTQRIALRSRHSSRLVALLDEREDLRGVYAMADYLDDAIRWST